MSTPQRDAILANIVSALDAITAGQTPTGSTTTYNTTPTVELATRNAGDRGMGARPWIGVVPQEEQVLEQMPFGVMRMKLPIELQLHIEAATTTAKSEAFSDLFDDIVAALQLDTTRGGKAIVTTVETGIRGNEADPDVRDASGTTGSALVRIAVEYERNIRLTAA